MRCSVCVCVCVRCRVRTCGGAINTQTLNAVTFNFDGTLASSMRLSLSLSPALSPTTKPRPAAAQQPIIQLAVHVKCSFSFDTLCDKPMCQHPSLYHSSSHVATISDKTFYMYRKHMLMRFRTCLFIFSRLFYILILDV